MEHPSQRTVPMQVLLLSPPRSGTLSMKLALEELLQAQVWHGTRLMSESTKPPKFWLNAVEAKFEGKGKPYSREDFDVGLGDFAGVSDLPGCFLWRELMDAYPEAKVILVPRDFESWIKSFDQAAVTGGAFTTMTYAVVMLEPLLGSYVATIAQKVILGYFHAKNGREVLANAEDVYKKHYDDIRKACASTPGRLLEMKIEEGWEPLCKFLGKDIPKTPFPRTNEIKALQEKTSEFRIQQFRKGVISALCIIAVPVVVGVAVYWYLGLRR